MKNALVFGWMLVALVAATGCVDPDVERVGNAGELAAQPFAQDARDLEPAWIEDGKGDAIPARFNRNEIVSDAFYRDPHSVDIDAIQRFLEDTPYGGPSWLATEQVQGEPLAQVLGRVANQYQINPILLLSRMQVEQSLVSRASRPSQYDVDRAMGCGCPDGRPCSPAYLGLERQLACAAQTMVGRYEDSVNATGQWRKGRARTALDGHRITPVNHATAALYAYTPWVLPGRGGNWLVWNVTQRFTEHLRRQGALMTRYDAWVGDNCASDEDCLFSDGEHFGFCLGLVPGDSRQGVCAIACEGYCPDKTGRASTFCVEDPLSTGRGVCAATSAPQNQYCEGLADATASRRTRFVGNSRATASQANVCLPDTAL